MADQNGRDPAFESLLEYLYQSHGFDFTGYKRTTLIRRVQRRLDDLHLTSFADYNDYLQVHPEEFPTLFDTILINVTGFFRDRESWEFLRTEVVQPLAATTQPIRIWSAGCASGEEPYSVAILFAEELGMEAVRDRVKIYATDVDEDALARARTGTYTLKELADLGDDLRDRYFEQQGMRMSFLTELRRSVIFGRHDLSRDAPISRLDLLLCRNTLMYFTSETQARILARYHYALADEGTLFMGRAEMLLTHANLFAPLDSRHRIFRKVPRDGQAALVDASRLDPGSAVTRTVLLRDLASDVAPVAQVTVDSDQRLVAANRSVRAMFGLRERDLGRRLQDLELSYRPLDLRSRIDQAQSTRTPVIARDVQRSLADGAIQSLDITVIPLPLNADGASPGTSILFADVTEYKRVQTDLVTSKQELETAYEELQSSNEELETTNEELQSTVEELETTNEEFQSANEELETMNEELQSTNGELQTVNWELRQRTDELNRISGFMESILGSLHMGLIVVDAEARVQVWNAASQELWGLRSEEVHGHELGSLDIGLPVGDLGEPIAKTLENGDSSELQLRATNRRGRALDFRVLVSPLGDRDGDGTSRGAIVLVEPVRASR